MKCFCIIPLPYNAGFVLKLEIIASVCLRSVLIVKTHKPSTLGLYVVVLLKESFLAIIMASSLKLMPRLCFFDIYLALDLSDLSVLRQQPCPAAEIPFNYSTGWVENWWGRVFYNMTFFENL